MDRSQDIRYKAGEAKGHAQVKKDEMVNKAKDTAQTVKDKASDAAQSAKDSMSSNSQSARCSAQESKEEAAGFLQQVSLSKLSLIKVFHVCLSPNSSLSFSLSFSFFFRLGSR
ncbi:hypothetical protein AMTRI_Chr07g76650 [Amborella trichopoda]